MEHTLTPSGKALRAGQVPINLKDILLRDTMIKSLDNDPESFQGVMDNVCTYVEIVHHNGFSLEMLQGKPTDDSCLHQLSTLIIFY